MTPLHLGIDVGTQGARVLLATDDGTVVARGSAPLAVPEPGRANVIACSRYLPDSERSCGWATDPRGFGLAAGSN